MLKLTSIKCIDCHLHIENLYEILCFFVWFVAYAYTSSVFVENWGFFAGFTFSVPVQNQLQGDKLLRRLTLKLAHGVLFTGRSLIRSNYCVVSLDVSPFCWNIFVLFNYCSVVLSNSLVSLVIKSNLSKSFASLKILDKILCVFLFSQRVILRNFLNWNDKTFRLVSAQVDRIKNLLFKLVFKFAWEWLH